MIRIAVVDDERQEREQLQKYYVKLQAEISEELDIHAFSLGEELLANYEYSYDLICLDIDMNGKDGIETAKEIRKLDAEVIIMFITIYYCLHCFCVERTGWKISAGIVLCNLCLRNAAYRI
ncbi:MAG: response regulator [Lachnospiraceae bacterium]|nr:response regulator [Lachnospiraceae bacterium]